MFTPIEKALNAVQSNNNVFIHTGAAAPHLLINELVNQSERLKSVQFYQLHTEGPAPYTDEK